MRALVWFRADLRVRDNPALFEACERAGRGVVGVFLVAHQQWRRHDWGTAKAELVIRAVADLGANLARLNIPLLIRSAPRFDDAPKALLEVAREVGAEELFFNEEYEVNERRRDEAVRAAFAASRLTCLTFHDQTTVPPALLRTGRGGFFTVFTPFRRAWVEHLCRAGVPTPLGEPRRQAEAPCRAGPDPGPIEGFPPRPDLATLWPGTRADAERRLATFATDAIQRYREDRDRPALHGGTSTLSPYLAAGVISARECLAAAVEAGGDGLETANPGPATWIAELAWREFYRHVLVGFPRVSMGRPFQLVTEKLAWRGDEDAFCAWQAGRTGVPIVDAGMRQLAASGWMHNRVRMIAAQFLTKHLLIDWRRGERHFMAHLVDADLANNNGGWQWCASTGTDAAPYFRIFNPYLQAKKFDPRGEYIRRWVPELGDVDPAALHDPEALARCAPVGRGYPAPIVDHRTARERALAAFKRIQAP